ncbi:MAG: hypothetical protein AAGA66_12455 [Bacteroidota bacterium]
MKITALTLLFFMTSLVGHAQDKFTDKVFYGGGFGFSSGAASTNVGLSPFVGYRITQRLLAGFGINYQYVRFKRANTSISNYGWNVFTRYNLARQFFIQTEFEQLNFEFFTGSNEQTERDLYNAMYVGAGYSESLGGRAAFSVSALYNVLYNAADDPQPYNSPWLIRAGLGVGIL